MTSLIFPDEEKIEVPRTAYPDTQRKYAITLSSNYAKHKNSYLAYYYVIRRFPQGTFKFVEEKSKNGKHHIHGIMQFTYNFSYVNLMNSLNTDGEHQFDMHIWYKQIKSYDDYSDYYDYCDKTDPQWYRIVIPSYDSRSRNPIPQDTCIPQEIFKQYVKTVYIPGLY